VVQLINLVTLLMTVATALILIRPLRVKRLEGRSHDAVQIAVYHDQLHELDREVFMGLIDPGQAELVRAELGRRILKEARTRPADRSPATPSRSSYLVFIIVVLAGGYLTNAVASTPELLFGAGTRETQTSGVELNSRMTSLRERLQSDPHNDSSWRDLTALFLREGRYADAERALREGIVRYGPNAERLDDLGQVLIERNNGVVVRESLALFEQVVEILPNDIRANFFSALSLEQSGQNAEAQSAFGSIADRLPADAPELPLVLHRLSEIAAKDSDRKNSGVAQ